MYSTILMVQKIHLVLQYDHLRQGDIKLSDLEDAHFRTGDIKPLNLESWVKVQNFPNPELFKIKT